MKNNRYHSLATRWTHSRTAASGWRRLGQIGERRQHQAAPIRQNRPTSTIAKAVQIGHSIAISPPAFVATVRLYGLLQIDLLDELDEEIAEHAATYRQWLAAAVAGSEGPTYIDLEEDAPSDDVRRTSSWAGTRALNADGGVRRSRSGAGPGKARLRSRGDATGRCGEGGTGGNDRGRPIRGW
jgi:hypothetical protein